MRVGRAAGRLVIIDGDGVVDVAAASDGEFSSRPDQVYAVWDRFTEWARSNAGPGARTGPLVPQELGAPVLTPAQVFGIGLNYAEHAAESGVDAPALPPVFTKFRSCLAGPYAAVELPSDKVDWEVELVAVIGRPADRVPEEKAWSYVAGLMVGQDLSERTVQLIGCYQPGPGRPEAGKRLSQRELRYRARQLNRPLGQILAHHQARDVGPEIGRASCRERV